MNKLEVAKINVRLPIVLASTLDESARRVRDIFAAAIGAAINEPPKGKVLMVMRAFLGDIHEEHQ